MDRAPLLLVLAVLAVRLMLLAPLLTCRKSKEAQDSIEGATCGWGPPAADQAVHWGQSGTLGSVYWGLPPVPMSADPAFWWWQKKDTLLFLHAFASKYLCVQASSTASERVFSTAWDTISPERSRILPQKADMLIFLHKNCYFFSFFYKISVYMSRDLGSRDWLFVYFFRFYI